MKYFTLHSYLSTRCLKERSILTLSSNGHSNWKTNNSHLEFPAKKNMYPINQFPHVLFLTVMTETYVITRIATIPGISAMPFRRSSTIRFHQREGGRWRANIMDGKWWLFSLCFLVGNKSNQHVGLDYHILSPRLSEKWFKCLFESEWYLQNFPTIE